MKIGQFVHFGIGGADRAAENLVKGLVSIGFVPLENLFVFYNEFSIPRLSSQYDKGASIVSRFDNYVNFKPIKIDNLEDLNNYGLAILNTHRSGDDFWAFPKFEEIDFNFKIVETNFHGQLQSKANMRVFPSQTMVEHCGITSKQTKYRVISNPILPPLNHDNFRSELGIGDKFVFGRISRPHNEIYSPVNLQAYKSIETDNTAFLYIAPTDQAKEDAKKLNIKNIIFMNQIVNPEVVSKVYNTFDVLCHSNCLGETFGNTIAEAMIHGKPVVSHIGNPDWAQAEIEVMGIESLFVRERDNVSQVIQYANIMSKLMSNQNYYNEISSKMKSMADQNYNYIVVASKYMKLYQEITQ